jgi:hypothetical protein
MWVIKIGYFVVAFCKEENDINYWRSIVFLEKLIVKSEV